MLWNHEKSLWRGFGAHLAGQTDRPDAPDAHFSKEIATLLIKAFTQTLSVYFERCCGLGLEHIPQAWYTGLMFQMCIFPRKPQRYLKSVVISIERLFWMLLWRGFGAPFAWPNQWPGPPATRCSKETATQTSHGNKINVSARHKHRKTPSACVHTRVHTHACVVHTRHAPCALRALSGAYIPPKANLARP